MAKRTAAKEDWEEDLEKEAVDESAREKARGGGAGNKISIRKARFSFDGEILGREMECVIVDFVYLNTYYDTKYDEENPGPPACFALSEDGEDVAPHENVADPQSDACEGCPKNEWGSGKGRAKACAQRRRLALIHKDDLDDAADATVAALELPPTSVANWSSFVKECRAKMGRPVYGVIAKLSFDTDESYPKVMFEPVEKIEDKDVIDAIKERRDDIREMLMTPFEQADEDDKPRRKKRRARDDDDDGDEKSVSRKRRTSRDDDEDDEDDEKPTRRKSRRDNDEDDDDEKPRKTRSSREDEEDEEEKPRRNQRRSRDDDEEEEERPRKRRGSRFGK